MYCVCEWVCFIIAVDVIIHSQEIYWPRDDVYWPRDEDPEEFESVGVTVQLLEHEDKKGLSATMAEVEREEVSQLTCTLHILLCLHSVLSSVISSFFSQTEQRHKVSFLQLTDWPTEAGEVPTSTDSMIQLVSLAH